MKIDLDWIQKELDAGEVVELECIDRDGFLAGSHFENAEILRRDIIVESVFPYRIDVNNCDYCIVESEYKHFRIKRPAPTFSDLIDVAVKAYKDGVIDNLEITKGVSSGAGVRINGNRQFTNSRPMDGINFINSLYTETFVIESEEDINKVISRKDIGFNKNSMSVATLTNGSEILITRLDSDNSDGVVIYMRRGLYKNYMDFEVLKGATVTQQKGNK